MTGPRLTAYVAAVAFSGSLTAIPKQSLAAGPLPALAVSLPATSDPATVTSLCETCRKAPQAVVVIPAGTVAMAADAVAPSDAAAAARMAELVPAELAVFFEIAVAPASGVRPEEAVVEARLAAFTAALPLQRAKGVILHVTEIGPDEVWLQFALATLAVKAKAARRGLQVVLTLPRGFSTGFGDVARRAAVYADSVGVPWGPAVRTELAWIQRTLNKPAWLIQSAPPDRSQPVDEWYLDGLTDAGDLNVNTIWVVPGAGDDLAALCRSAGLLAHTLPAAAAVTASGRSPVTVTLGDGLPPAAAMFLDSQTSDIYVLVRANGTRLEPKPLVLTAATGRLFEAGCLAVTENRAIPMTPLRQTASGRVQTCDADAGYVLVSVRWGGADQRLHETVSVTGKAQLTVDEIIARWQQHREAQRREFDNAISSCLLSLHFEPAGLGGGFDVALELRHFTDRTGLREWAQTGFFLNGVRLKNRREFPLPQLEPQRVATQPLELRLEGKYSYTLLGVDTIDGSPVYVVRIEPSQSQEALYSGRVWIDGVTFRQVRVQLEQRGHTTNVVSHLETQDFSIVVDAQGRTFNVLKSIYVHEVLNAAGRSFLLEKIYAFADYAINTPGFDAALKEARLSDDPMFRDTEAGLRPLRKEGDTRVVQPIDTRRIRSLVLGAFYDGSYDYPVPLGGLSLVDFDFSSTGGQLSLFFAGPIAAANLSWQLNDRWRVGVDGALSALPQNLRVFTDDTEATAERLWVYGETGGGLVNWQPSPGWSLTASSHLTWNIFRATSDTDPSFLVPPRGFTIENGGEVRFVRRGYVFAAAAWRGDRLGWGTFGYTDAPLDLPGSFVKYTTEFGKQAYFGRFTKLGLAAGYYGGSRLDRFSRYQPSFLTRPKIRGIPSGTDTFDSVAIVGISYGFNVSDVAKLEGAYNHAWGRNLDESSAYRNFDGLEFDIGTAVPWGMFLQGTVNYAIRGNLDRYPVRWGFYLLFFKPW